MGELSPGTIAALGGLLGGCALGFAARWGRFCTLGAVEDVALAGDSRRLRMWGLAIAIAMFITFAMYGAGLIDITQTFYLATPTTIVATVVGSFMFGYGMSLVGTCGFGTLARIGGGDLKSVFTFLIMGITAYATMSGAGAYLRLFISARSEPPMENASFAFLIGDMTGLSPVIVGMAFALVIVIYCFSSASFRQSPRFVIAAVIVGLAIAFGWFVTGYLALDPFEPYPLESFTFAAPLGESILYVMAMTGSSLNFGIGAVAGVIIGAAVTTLFQKHFRWEVCDDAREMRRQMMGGVLMGFGSVTALGCTVGQGLTGASLLAFSTPIAFVSMYAGSWVGLHKLVHGSVLEPLKQVLFQRR